MIRFSANLNFLYGKLPFPDQFSAAAADGFKAVEFVSPYNDDPAAVRKALDDNGLIADLFNFPYGERQGTEWPGTVLSCGDQEFENALLLIRKYAPALDCKKINMTAGLLQPGQTLDQVAGKLVGRWRRAADDLGELGITVLVENINDATIPNYSVSTPEAALSMVGAVDRPNCKIQYDTFHACMTGGDMRGFLMNNFDAIGHIQIADFPGRHEPGTGAVDFPELFAAIDRLGYRGWIGLEYTPSADTSASLGWLRNFTG